MKYSIKLFILLFLCLSADTIWAQQTLSGQVLNAGNQPADAASVALITATDSSVVKMTISDEQGRFAFDNITPGNYRLWVTMVGHKEYKSETLTTDAQALILPAITLEQDGTRLQEVSIVARKPFIERKVDRTVVNVDALIANSGTTALDVLEKSPGVRVDQNGTISLKGKDGVIIFIDDKPAYLSGNDLQQYLKSLPSSALEQIELMPNPPARYDAAGNAGIINIKTKKNKSRGFNGNLSLSYSQGKYARSNNSLNLNYREGKFNVFATLSYNKQNNFNDLDIYRRYKNADESTRSYFMQNTYIRRTGDGLTGKLGIDFNADEHNTIGILLNGTSFTGTETNDNTSNIRNAAGSTDSVIKALNTEKNKFRNAGINLNYRHKFDKEGREFSADLDYIFYKTGSDQVFNNTGYLSDGSPTTHDVLTGSLPATLHIYTAKADYTHPLKSGYVLSAGAKTSYIKTDNLAVYNYTVKNITQPDYDKSNHFIYKEQISAGYLNLNKDYKRLSVQLGLRLEHTGSNGHQLGNVMKPDSVFKRSYTNLFPTLYLLYKLDSAADHQVSFNFGRRITRPYFQDLNPFISPLDKFTYYVGNPFLKPAFTNSLELSYTYKNRITAGFTYGSVRDEVNETIEIQNGTYYSRPGNLGRNTSISFTIDALWEPAPWVRLHCYNEISNIHTRSDFYTGRLDTRGTFWFVQPDVQFQLGKGWTVEASGVYNTDITNAQFISGANGRVNAGVQKTKGNATFKLGLLDIFRTAVNKGIINNLANTEATYNNVWDTRQAVLTFSYRFGRELGGERKHTTTGAESEKNRVKN
jgi:hypothetical protein